MNKRTKESLVRALSYCSLRELPPIDSGEDVWIKALALVEKSDGCDYFVDLQKDPTTLLNKVKKDFGHTGSIVRYKEVYPYLYLSSNFMPTFSDNTKESRVTYLERVNPTGNWRAMSLKALNSAIIGVAISSQLNNIKSNTIYITEQDGEDGIETEA